MTEDDKSREELLLELEELRVRLDEAEDTLRAIRDGEVDAILGHSPEGDQIYTLQGAEQPYRLFFDAMSEGAVTMTVDGTILYCNGRFAEMTRMPLEKVTGMSLLDFITDDARQAVADLLLEKTPNNRSIESFLNTREGKSLPVKISMSSLRTNDLESVCAIVTDMSQLVFMRRLEETNKEINRNVRELEYFNELMVGRELRMIELKKEVDELCVKAGLPPRYYGIQ